MHGLDSIITAEGARVAGVALAIFAGAAGLASSPALAQSDATTIQGALIAPEVDAEPWVRTELFFGTAKPDGTVVTDAEWSDFSTRRSPRAFPTG